MPYELRRRITDQFSDGGERNDIWRLFDLVLDTDQYLNLGYSEWYRPHFLGPTQRRLVEELGFMLETDLSSTCGVPLLDVGCGRGGPTVYFAEEFGVVPIGIDLVPYNIERARNVASRSDIDAMFVVGDATCLPFGSSVFTACTAIDSLTYLADRQAAFESVARVLEPGGIMVLSDIVVRSTAGTEDRREVDAFAEAWDMPPLDTVPEYRRKLTAGGFEVCRTRDITSHSLGQFRRWTALFRRVINSPFGRIVEHLLRRHGLDPTRIIDRIYRAHDALPHLSHVIVTAEVPA